MPSNFQSLQPQSRLVLTQPASMDRSAHQWSQAEIDALTLADAAQRPLLLRGEPGTGKTQLARAAAQHRGWALLAETVHPRFEAQDLVFRFDAVRRLADAQAGQVQPDPAYYEPGPLWQAFDWRSASQYGSCRGAVQPRGHVILIDEIDKADSDLPNSLLEVLGARTLPVAPLGRSVGDPAAARPLIIITTNEERELPPAFLRRCVVLNLSPPPDADYLGWLVSRGETHFGAHDGQAALLDTATVIQPAAHQLVQDRAAATEAGLSPPGPAEFLDMLAALHRLAPGNPAAQRHWLDRLSAYAFIKHGGMGDRPGLSQQRRPLPGAGA